MGDDNEQNLLNYKLQLQQVEAALELDKDNEELKALKSELEEIIGLTLQLLGRDPNDALDVGEAFGWKVGDQCSAIWTKDKLYYPAVVTEVKRDGTCFVSFAHLPAGSHPEKCQVSLLKPLADSSSAGDSSAAALTAQGSNAAAAKKRRREERTKALETKARKTAKRLERDKQMEAAVEQEKRSWQSFSKKVQKQGKLAGRSIFATPGPDNPKGRVGVGTCGIAGRGMTPFAAPLHRPPGTAAGPASAGGSSSLTAAAPAGTSAAAAASAAAAYAASYAVAQQMQQQQQQQQSWN